MPRVSPPPSRNLDRFCSLGSPTRPPVERAALEACVPAELLDVVLAFEGAYGGRILRSATGDLTELGVLKEGVVEVGNGVITLARAGTLGGSHAWMSLRDGTVCFSDDFAEEATVGGPMAWLNFHAANSAMFERKRTFSGVGLRGPLSDADFDALFGSIRGEAIYSDGAALVFWSELACGQRWREHLRLYLRHDRDAYDLLTSLGAVGCPLEVFFASGPYPARASLHHALHSVPVVLSYPREAERRGGRRELRGAEGAWAIVDSTTTERGEWVVVVSSSGRSSARG